MRQAHSPLTVMKITRFAIIASRLCGGAHVVSAAPGDTSSCALYEAAREVLWAHCQGNESQGMIWGKMAEKVEKWQLLE